MNLQAMTGLEVLRAMVDGHLPMPTMGQTIPMHALAVEEGYIKFGAKADERHSNPMGGVHGGFAATVLDSVTGCAVHSKLAAGESYGTVDLSVKMVRPVPRNQELVAEARLINISDTVAIAEGDLKDSAGRLLAHATATCIISR